MASNGGEGRSTPTEPRVIEAIDAVLRGRRGTHEAVVEALDSLAVLREIEAAARENAEKNAITFRLARVLGLREEKHGL